MIDRFFKTLGLGGEFDATIRTLARAENTSITELVSRFIKKGLSEAASTLGLDPVRPTWPETWMSVARVIGERSYDNRMRVGSIIVSDDNTQVLSVGYNGNFRGGPNKPASLEPGKSEFIHSELNALLKCNFNFPKRKHMYVTHVPCRMCAKYCINGGVSRVVYEHPYRDMSGLDVLREGGVEALSLAEAIVMARAEGTNRK